MNTVIKLIARAIKDTEFAGKTYIAGGYVRDLLLDNENNDLDIAVALPDGGAKLAHYLYNHHISTKPVIFEQFGTALVEINEHKIEFVMTRKESYRKGNRKPSTKPGTLLEDISRRDFTVNSLVMDIMTGKILDLTGMGLSDLNKGIIRATSDPDFIFQDDPLRILRAVRFANRLHFHIEESTAQAMIKDAPQLVNISWERRRDELEKILLDVFPDQGINLIYKFGLMEYLIPELAGRQNEVYLQQLLTVPDIIHVRLAALLQILGKDPESSNIISQIIERLRFSSKIQKEVIFLVDNCNKYLQHRFWEDEKIVLRRICYFHDDKLGELIGYISYFIDYKNRKSICNKLMKACSHIIAEFAFQRYPLNGNIIKREFNLPDCSQIGIIKEKGLDIWLRHPDISKKILIALLKKEYHSI